MKSGSFTINKDESFNSIFKGGMKHHIIDYIEKKILGSDLQLGFRGEHVHFRHRPYHDRPKEHREDFDRLIVSTYHNGVKNPLITFNNHVLIGMRRYEIMMKFNPDYVFNCWDIQEDVNLWTRADLDKIYVLEIKKKEIKY